MTEFLRFIRRTSIVSFTVLTGESWRHPWQLTPRWNGVEQRWETTIQPGLVNGLDATLRVTYASAPLGTVERLKRTGEDKTLKPTDGLDAWLSERPLMPLTGFRAVGSDASPSGASEAEDGSVSYTYDAVPAFFLDKGVGAPPQVGGAGNIERSISGQLGAEVRLLRAMDVVLYQDRVSTASQLTVSRDALDSTILTYNVTTKLAPNARDRAYLRAVSKYSPPDPLQDALARLSGDWSDNTRDELLLATVYLLSPYGLAAGSPVDETWQPYVKHQPEACWNFRHAGNQLPPPLDATPLTLNTGLAGGVGDRINQFLLAQVNDANSAAAQFLNRNTIEGTFWT